MDNKWPEYTCVLVYVYESLKRLNFEISPKELAKHLDIKVATRSFNPFHFKEVVDENIGIDAHTAEIQINNILNIYTNGKYVFKHIKFSTIPWEAYEEYAISALDNNIIVGVGYNYSSFIKETEKIKKAKHVSFINKIDSNKVELTDYYINSKGVNIISDYMSFVKSVLEINDGFWLIGAKKKIDICLI